MQIGNVQIPIYNKKKNDHSTIVQSSFNCYNNGYIPQIIIDVSLVSYIDPPTSPSSIRMRGSSFTDSSAMIQHNIL